MVSFASSRSWDSIAKRAAGLTSREPAALRRSESSRSTIRVATTAGSGSDWCPSDGASAECHAPSAVVAALHQNRIGGGAVWLRFELPATEHGEAKITRGLLADFGRGAERRGRGWRILPTAEQRRRQRQDTQDPDPSDVHALCPLCTPQRRRPAPPVCTLARTRLQGNAGMSAQNLAIPHSA